MKKLKVVAMGDEVQGVRLHGDRRDPEPTHFRVTTPFGDVDVARTTDDDYWIHVRVNRPQDGGDPERPRGRITAARIDSFTPDVEFPAGALADGGLYHLAVRIQKAKPLRRRRRG